MLETGIDIARLAAAGAMGGLIYWALRTQSAPFVDLWRRLAQR